MNLPAGALLLELILLNGIQHGLGSSADRPSAKQGLSSPGNAVLFPVAQQPAGYAFPQQSSNLGFQDEFLSQSFKQYSHYGYQDYGYVSQPKSQNRRSKNNLLPFLLIIILNLIRSAIGEPTIAPSLETPTTTPLTTKTFSGDCQWAAWSTCSLPCRGTRYRLRKCIGNTQTDSELCNTQTGMLPDGLWYRAGNCYDYRFFPFKVSPSYQSGVEGCSSHGARLASTGLRNEVIRRHVIALLPEDAGAFIGITDQSVKGVYVWSDGYVGNPTFWYENQPSDDDARRCLTIIGGRPWGLGNVECAYQGVAYYLCERKV